MAIMTNQLKELAYSQHGFMAALAKEMDVERSTVLRWVHKGVPPKHVLTIEKRTGISRYELRPDIFGESVE